MWESTTIHFSEYVAINTTYFNCCACLMTHPLDEKMEMSCSHDLGIECGEAMVGKEYGPGDQVTHAHNGCPECRAWFIHPKQASQQWVVNNGGVNKTIERLTETENPVLCCGIDEKNLCLQITKQTRRGLCGPAGEQVQQLETKEEDRQLCQDCKDIQVILNAKEKVEGFIKVMKTHVQGKGGFWYPKEIGEEKRTEDDALRPCPKCLTFKGKDGGCGHMECECGAHYCWCCGVEFETGDYETIDYNDEYYGDPYDWNDVYDHMMCVFNDLYPSYAQILDNHIDETLKYLTGDEILGQFIETHDLYH